MTCLCRTGVYHGAHSGPVVQILVLGDLTLTLGQDNKLVAWTLGQYDTPLNVIQLPVSVHSARRMLCCRNRACANEHVL